MRISQENENCNRQSSHQPPTSSQEKTPDYCLNFPRAMRLRKKRDFAPLQRSATRLSGQFLQIDYRLGHSPRTRLGITVSKRYGKAHDRNRFKRLVREAFRLHRPLLPSSIDLNVLPKRGCSPQHARDCVQDFKKLIDVFQKLSAN